MIVFDTDTLSMVAKIDEVYLLKQFFGDKAVITPEIRDEISAPLEYWYSFPLEVLSTIKTLLRFAMSLILFGIVTLAFGIAITML